MESEQIQFVRLVGNERRVGSRLAEVSRHWQGERECFLFVSPHDDDAALGAGLFMQLAEREKVPVYVLIVTDGSMGYCTMEEQATITQTRYQESLECYRQLKIPKENLIWLAYPDCRLTLFRGRQPIATEAGQAIGGFVGLQNSFTYYLRKVRPTQCFLATHNDLHPDHQIVYDEFLISVFHAAGEIWPELGQPLEKPPYLNSYAVYCDFAGPPTLQVRTPPSHLETKLGAIAAFRSQKQVSTLVENVRRAGPEEYFRALDFALYHPAHYRTLFDEKPPIEMMH
jgi:LmbE family N-acetylglucosaminyl deacetylase